MAARKLTEPADGAVALSEDVFETNGCEAVVGGLVRMIPSLGGMAGRTFQIRSTMADSPDAGVLERRRSTPGRVDLIIHESADLCLG